LNIPWTSKIRLTGGATILVAGVVGVAAVGCGGSVHENASAKPPETARAESLKHEDCSITSNRVEAVDTNGDGKPDIQRVFDKGSGKEVCRIGDLNHDGKPDLYEYFDASGAVRRREFCYDDTGVVNAVEHYDNGKLVAREYDAAGQHRIDTWDFFDPSVAPDPKTGRPAHPARRERDTTGDGHIDQWWTWNGDKVTIAVDRSGDGKPDPESTIVLGPDNAPVQQDTSGDAPAATPPSGSSSPAPSPSPSSSRDGGAS
jgi:hypothetical protein